MRNPNKGVPPCRLGNEGVAIVSGGTDRRSVQAQGKGIANKTPFVRSKGLEKTESPRLKDRGHSNRKSFCRDKKEKFLGVPENA